METLLRVEQKWFAALQSVAAQENTDLISLAASSYEKEKKRKGATKKGGETQYSGTGPL